MSNTQFSVLEVLRLAISMEEEGYDFYEKLSKKANGEAKAILERLAQDELQHVKVFSKMYDEMEQTREINDYLFSQSIDEFFKSYVKHVAFKREEQEYSSVEEAIKVGVETEGLTVDYYKGLMEHANEATQKILQRMIEEELEHKKILEDLLASRKV